MKHAFLLSFAFLALAGCDQQVAPENIVTKDIDHFWEAYDQVVSTTDSTQQMQYLKDLYLDKGSPGLSAIMQARRYQPEEYLKAINDYPAYWNSIRDNTLSAHQYAEEIQEGINAFKGLYPDCKPAKVYFEMGVFRTSGTAMDSMVLIGAELAMTDESTNTSELPESMDYVKAYTKNNPIEDLAFLNVHEFVHTQQNVSWAYDLLSQSLYEGSAEFIAEVATQQPSIQAAIDFGKKNDEWIKEVFSKEMFSPWYYNWIWNSTENEFKTRDLGYYMGYAIVQKHYENAADKKQAIKDIIELDYTKPEAIEAFVESTGYFSEPLSVYKEQYENSRPTVVGVEGLEENSQNVPSKLTTFKVLFSSTMDQRFRSTDFGPSGKDHFPKINTIEFSEDGMSAIYQVELQPNTTYEMVIESGYRTPNAIPLQPYTLKFKTAE
jgi:hypothetical protein